MKCLITGCGFYDEASNKSLYGDLFEAGECYIFNGVVDHEGDAKWQYGGPLGMNATRVVTADFGYDYFEKRGVIVLNKTRVTLSTEAKAYLGL